MLVAVGLICWWAFNTYRQVDKAKVDEELAREQEMRKLKELVDTLTRQQGDVQQKYDELTKLVGGGPHGAAAIPQGNKFAAETAQALVKAKMEDFLTRAQEAKSMAAKLEKVATAWGPRIKEILDGEPGKKLAANKSQLEQLATHLEKERLSAEMAQSWSKQLKTLLDPVDAAVKAEDTFYSPPENLAQTIDGLAKNVRDRLREYEADQKVLESLLAESQNNPAQKRQPHRLSRISLQSKRSSVSIWSPRPGKQH